MGDEQTPQSDLIDDAIRQAEQQLEAKLEALRMSALGDIASPAPVDDDIAVLRPTSPVAETPARDAAPSTAWQEVAGDDLIFQPTAATPTPAADTDTELFFPDPEPTTVPSSSVTDLIAAWDEPDTEPDVTPALDADLPSFLEAQQAETSHPRASAWDTPAAAPLVAPATPSEDEMQFWAHTRTALRSLQQATDAIPGQVSNGVVSELDRLIREEAAVTSNALRLVQQTMQKDLPAQADRIEDAIAKAVAAPNERILDLGAELPKQLDGVVQATRTVIGEDLDQTARNLHEAVQKDVSQLEQSIATNVTRMTHGLTEGVGRVERDVDTLGETVVRFERGVHSEFDRVEAQLRAAIEHVEQHVREDLVSPSETVRKLDEELPARFNRIERTLLEQMQTTQRDLSTVLTGLVEANRAALDRIASLSSTFDEERRRRTDDVELVVDTVTTGWEGLASAVKTLFAQGEETSRRVAALETQLGNVKDLETTVKETMADFQKHVSNLTPAPVVVTVAHPEAEVRNSARGGWLPDTSSNK